MPLLVAVMRLVAVDVVYISKVWSSDSHFEADGVFGFHVLRKSNSAEIYGKFE